MTPERLRPVLEREHRQWIQEVAAVIEPASRSDAGVWARWNALRYLQTTFPERLDQERRLVEGMAEDLTDDQREILWALGGLLDALCLQLDHLIGLCHQAPQFALVTGNILTTLRHWCRAVEVGLGPRAIAVHAPAVARGPGADRSRVRGRRSLAGRRIRLRPRPPAPRPSCRSRRRRAPRRPAPPRRRSR